MRFFDRLACSLRSLLVIRCNRFTLSTDNGIRAVINDYLAIAGHATIVINKTAEAIPTAVL